MMHRSLVHASWILAATAWCASGESLPPLPQPDLTGLDTRYRNQAAAALLRANEEPRSAEAVGALGMLLHAFGRTEDAVTCYQRSRGLAPESFRWAYYLGASLDELQRRGAAIEVLAGAESVSGDYGPYFVRLGELLRAEGRTMEAAAALRRAIELQPDLPSAHAGLGRVLADEGRWADAVQSYEKATDLAPNFGAAYYRLGLAYRRADRPQEAKRALERYERLKPLTPPTFDPLMDAVAALRGYGSSTVAPGATFTLEQRRAFAEELERAVSSNPQLVSAHANLVALYWQLGEAERAEANYRAALAIDPEYADAHYNWAGVELARRRPQSALESYERALHSYPEHLGALVQSGLLLERAGRGAEAEQRYRKALRVDPTQRQANYLLARRLVGRAEFAEAARLLEEAVRLEDAATPNYLRALASAYLRGGQIATARERLEEGLRQAMSAGRDDLAQQIRSDLQRLPK